jgi:hypothetical protein
MQIAMITVKNQQKEKNLEALDTEEYQGMVINGRYITFFII